MFPFRKTYVPFFVFVFATAPLWAGFTNYSGNTRPHKQEGVGATINFSVLYWDPKARWDAWGTGYDEFDLTFVPGEDWEGKLSPPLDRRAKYLYVYQIVNDGQWKIPIDAIDIGRAVNSIGKVAPITSWGYFKGMGLADDKKKSGKPIPVSFKNTFGPPAQAAHPAKAKWGKITWPSVVPIDSGKNEGIDPAITYLMPRLFRGSWEKPIEFKKRGTLFGFTSNYPPILDWVSVDPHPDPDK